MEEERACKIVETIIHNDRLYIIKEVSKNETKIIKPTEM
jgi:hypothetical protein